MKSNRSWRTSLMGIFVIAGSCVPIVHGVLTGKAIGADEVSALMVGISGGIGLIKAKDAQVTGLPKENEK